MPIKGVEMRVVDDCGNEAPVGITGELQVCGHNVMKAVTKSGERGCQRQPKTDQLSARWLLVNVATVDGLVRLAAR
jgi:acyl-CoA synthetase (AMP-forming)/AMP-acid ligase II